MNERQICARRRRLLIGLLQKKPTSTVELDHLLNVALKADHLPTVSRRQIQADLKWLEDRLPANCFKHHSESGLDPESYINADAKLRNFHFIDQTEGFFPVAEDIGILTETEVLALITARGLLDQSVAKKADATATRAPLADALDHVIKALGIAEADVSNIHIPTLNQTASERYNSEYLRVVLYALRIGVGLKLEYQPLRKKSHPAFVQPIRLVLVNGEPYIWAWDRDAKEADKLKNYKVSRINSIEPLKNRIDVPPGQDKEVQLRLAVSFAGVVGRGPERRVTIRFDAAIVPLVEHRTLGRNQIPKPLPDGSLELCFFTKGVAALRHWLMQFGRQAIAVEPPELIRWMQEEAKAMTDRYQA